MASNGFSSFSDPYRGSNPLFQNDGGNSLTNWQKKNGLDLSSNGWGPGNQIIKESAAYLFPLEGEQLQFGGGLEGQREGAIRNAIQDASAGGNASRINAFSNQANESAATAAHNLGNFNAGQGVSGAATSGQTANLFNNAAAQTNQYAAQQASPEAQMQRLQQILSAIQSGQTSPALQQELQLYGPQLQGGQLNAQLNAQNNAFGNMAGGILGQVAGGVLSGDIFPNMFASPTHPSLPGTDPAGGHWIY